MSRHKARQQALELLYSREFHGENDIQYSEQEILENDYVTTDALSEDGPELSDQERNDYCTYLVETTTEHRTNWIRSSAPLPRAGTSNG